MPWTGRGDAAAATWIFRGDESDAAAATRKFGRDRRAPRQVAVAAAFGQAHAPLFRLDGPFATSDASDVVATELLEPIKMRGLMNVVFFGNLCFFAAVNALATLVEWTLAPLARTKHV